MQKRRKFPFRKRFDSSDSDDNIIIETPPNDNNIRLLLSNYTHDSHFIFQTIVSKYDIHPVRNEHNLSLQPHHEIYRPDISPQIFRANKALLEESPVNSNNQHEASQILKTTATSISPSRRKGCVLNPVALPAAPVQMKPVKTQTLRDLVRRKSCHCRDCGGLTKLEKKALHLPPDLLKIKLRYSPSPTSTPKVATNTPRNPGKSPIKKPPPRRRGSVTNFLSPKKPENEDFLSLPLSDMPTRIRNKTYDTSVSGIIMSRNASRPASSIEKIEEEEGSKKYLDVKMDRNSSRKTSGRNTSGKNSERSFDKSFAKQEKSRKSLSGKDASNAKIVSTKAKKIYIKRSTPAKQRINPSGSNADQSVKIYSSETKINMSQESLKKNFTTDKPIDETPNRKTVSTAVSKDITRLKKILSNSVKESAPLKILRSEKIYRAAPFEMSLEKARRKQNNESMAEKRTMSLPRLSVITQKKESGISDSFIKEKTLKGEGPNESISSAFKVQIRGKPPLWMQTYSKREAQTSREHNVSVVKGNTQNDSFIQNIKASVEDNNNKLSEGFLNMKKKSKVVNPLWKIGNGSTISTYREIVQKVKGASGSQSYRSVPDLAPSES